MVVSLHCWPKLLHCMLSWEKPNHSSGISTENSPCQEFASLGLICRQRNIFPCIFLRDLLTIPLEGINLCTSKIFLYNGCICYLTQLQHLWAHWKNYWPAVYRSHSQCFSVDHVYGVEGVVKGFQKIANNQPSWILPATCCTLLMHHWQGGLAPLCQSHSEAAFLEIKCLPQTRLWSKIFSAHSFLLIAEIHLFNLSLGSFHTSSPWLVNIEGILTISFLYHCHFWQLKWDHKTENDL